MMYSLKKIFCHSPGHYITALILAATVGAFRFSALPEGIDVRFAWYEVLSVSGYVTFLIGALLMVGYLGAFDLFGYAFSSWGTGEHKKYKDYVHYSEKKAEKRARGKHYFIPYYVVGAVIVVISTLLG